MQSMPNLTNNVEDVLTHVACPWSQSYECTEAAWWFEGLTAQCCRSLRTGLSGRCTSPGHTQQKYRPERRKSHPVFPGGCLEGMGYGGNDFS